MNSLKKKLLIAVLMGSSGIATLCQAASVQNQRPQIIQNENSTIVKEVSAIAIEGSTFLTQANGYNAVSFNEKFVEKITRNAKNVSCESAKRNDVYELTALFNDKLQMLLSYFDKKPTHQPYEVVENKDKINISNVTRS